MEKNVNRVTKSGNSILNTLTCQGASTFFLYILKVNLRWKTFLLFPPLPEKWVPDPDCYFIMFFDKLVRERSILEYFNFWFMLSSILI